MSATAAAQQPAPRPAVSRFKPGQAVLLTNTKGRPSLPATVRQFSPPQLASLIDGEARPYLVTVDDGLCAGLKLWAAERELVERST